MLLYMKRWLNRSALIFRHALIVIFLRALIVIYVPEIGIWLCLNAGPAAPVPHPLDRTVRQSSIGGCLANESNGPASRVQFHSHLEAVAAR